jgi:hypothetical protein
VDAVAMSFVQDDVPDFMSNGEPSNILIQAGSGNDRVLVSLGDLADFQLGSLPQIRSLFQPQVQDSC